MSQTWRISRLCLLGTFSSFRPRKIQEKNQSWNQEKTKAQKTSYWLHKQDKNNLWSLLKNGLASSFEDTYEKSSGKIACLSKMSQSLSLGFFTKKVFNKLFLAIIFFKVKKILLNHLRSTFFVKNFSTCMVLLDTYTYLTNNSNHQIYPFFY